MEWMAKALTWGGMAPRLSIGLAVALAIVGTDASAQMYSWKDAKGVTHFSDQPPPDRVDNKTGIKSNSKADSKAGPVVARTTPRTGASQPSLPYNLAEAARRNPVVLYTTASCSACDQGRALLQQRGVPFTEKTVTSSADQQQLKDAGSDLRLPLLVVGSSKQIGFEAVGWQDALTAANYPLQSRLPAGWRQPPAVAAAPQAAPAPATGELAREVASPADITPVKPPAENAPPGFQF